MRNLAVIGASAVLLAAGAVSAQAASTPAVPAEAVAQNSQSMKTADQPAAQHVNIREQLKNQLATSGYTDVNVMPASFLVHAKDKQGNAVEMVVGPDSFTEVTEIAAKPAPAPTASKASSGTAGKTAATKS